MSRDAPINVRVTPQEGSILVEWDIDSFGTTEPETPHNIIIELGQGGPSKSLDGEETSTEIDAALLAPFAGVTIAINVGFQWDGGVPLWSFTLLFVPLPGNGPILPEPDRPPDAPHRPPAPRSLGVGFQDDHTALFGWKNSASYDKIIVLWGPQGAQPTQVESEASGVNLIELGPIREDLSYVFSVKGGVSLTLGGFNYSAWSGIEVRSPETPWRKSSPGFGREKAAPDTSPTSWYTTPENVQHIAYVGVDGQIHELFLRIGSTDGWLHAVPSFGHDKVAPGSSPTSWYTTPENVQHIAYVGADQQIHEAFFRIGSTDGWLHNIPSAGHAKVAPGTSPTSWYTTPENIQHIAYVGVDQKIHELFFRIGGPDGWQHIVPDPDHIQVASRSSPTSWVTKPENFQHIAYVGVDGQIHELFFKLGAGNRWHHGVPSAGQQKVAPGTSPTSWYSTPENVQHIAYVGTDQRIHQCYFFVGGFGGWRHEVTSAGRIRVAPNTSPTSWYTTPENVQHIGYVGTDTLLQELYFFVRAHEVWRHRTLTADNTRAGTSPTSWYTTPENVQHIGYVGVDGQIEELFYKII